MKVLPSRAGEITKTGYSGTGGGRSAQTATQTPSTAFGTIAATNVQAALEEIVAETSAGAPTTADYLVGTANGSLSAEIVVGTSPGGELGGTWASPTVDATHSGSAHTDFVAKTFFAAKGDILTATANDTPAILSAGTDGYRLKARAGATNGIEWVAEYAGIPFIISGGGSAITTGSKGFTEVPFDCVIESSRLVADQSGSITITIKKATYSGLFTLSSIVASAKPTLSSAQKSEDTTLTGWTTTLTKGDWLEWVVDTVSTVTQVTSSLGVRKT